MRTEVKSISVGDKEWGSNFVPMFDLSNQSPMSSPDDAFLFSVDLIEGRGFGFELQALSLVATFGGESKETPYSVAKDAHVWRSTLQWRVTRQQLRKLSANGQSQCKVHAWCQ